MNKLDKTFRIEMKPAALNCRYGNVLPSEKLTSGTYIMNTYE